MSQIKITVIIPVFNSERYIPSCLDSLVNQNFEGLEVILVNDGSTDNSVSICNKYAEKYNIITVVNKMNGGLCSARNKGLDLAKGEYILFMDNDDELSKGALHTIWNVIEQLNCDILRYNRRRIQIFDDGRRKEDIYGSTGICHEGQKVCMSREEFFRDYKKVRNSGCFSGIWNGVFKKSLFNDIRFDTEITAGGEDWLVNLELYRRFHSIGFISDVLYVYYRRTSHSISTTFQLNRILAVKKTANKERELILENHVPISELLHSDIIYISQIVKVMMHPDSKLKYKDKVKILKAASSEPGLDLKDVHILRTTIPIFEKIYLLCYKYGFYFFLIRISEMILKFKSNT